MEDYMATMSNFYMIVLIIAIIFGFLQIILFFKIWGMTNDIRKIKDKYVGNYEKGTTEEKDYTAFRVISVLLTVFTIGIAFFIPFWITFILLFVDVVLLFNSFIHENGRQG